MKWAVLSLLLLPSQAKSQGQGYQSDPCFQSIHQFLKAKKDLPIELKAGLGGSSQNAELLHPEIDSLIHEKIRLRKLPTTKQNNLKIIQVTNKIDELLLLIPADRRLYAESLRIYRHFIPAEDKSLKTESLVTGALLWDYYKLIESLKSYRGLLDSEESRVSRRLRSGRGDISGLVTNEFILPNAETAQMAIDRLEKKPSSSAFRGPEFYLARRLGSFQSYALSITQDPGINSFCKKTNFKNRVAIFKDLGVTDLGKSHELALKYANQTFENYLTAETRLNTLTYQYTPRVPLSELSAESARRIANVRGDTFIQSTTLAIQEETKAMERVLEIKAREAARSAQ